MAQIASILEILLITNKSGKAKKSGNDYSINEAHCVLRNEDGTPGAVGVLVIPKQLEEVAKQGMPTLRLSAWPRWPPMSRSTSQSTTRRA